MQHRNKRHTLRALAALLAGAALYGGAAQAAGYPERPINLIVSYGPGGGTDLVARMMAPFLQKYLGADARIVVLNRPGAGGAIGFTELARAQPDGYTIGFINTPNLLTIPIERKSGFTWQSYDLLGNLIDDPGAFTVLNDNPMKTLADLSAYAKQNPGRATVGTTGTGSDDHLAMLRFERASGTTLSHIPYKGAGEVRGALAGGEIAIGAINVGEALQYQKGGTPLRFLGQMGKTRSAALPDVPTFKEQGYDFELASLRGLAAPKGLPEDVRAKLVDAVKRTVDDPAFQAKAGDMYAPLRYLPPAGYATELAAGEAEFRQLWKDAPWLDK
ncbi:tripartite tricarboxylate transporter substrate binding protein [Achromobacter denitrificans]|jgi:tripartite-type tricarboxylate transporter receptor subunit TctC|uniref:Tripartite tricarboxylate transporter substrate binding protein n=1 Tax=Achromobacter denitrificans TaxID=32002 RepID=A0A3R9FF13_ACHDE|nr:MULTISPECIES: tripartite tricarboxylate transporter substrate binding protein [Achromobacter]ASC67914.1 3-phosphoglycerate dehydrogenase [Achromobacter denitrificans]MBV2162359.1 tripartite tricarboxylate transporter substrate binding protein [Achromobacter denitrificans]MDF3851746.1 tripartite tricarboxylate transporter substrate binding protein [Achromobacter denitrificans]MDF3858006.1 tripartite tricarboxylate transporter substrate binding protein [Achromobacter denitrificans]MDF3940455.